MSQFVYTTLAGKKLNLEELNAKEKKLVRKLLKKYQRNSPYHCFVNEVNRDLLLDLMQGEKVFYWVNSKVAATVIYQLAADLEDRLGIRQGYLRKGRYTDTDFTENEKMLKKFFSRK